LSEPSGGISLTAVACGEKLYTVKKNGFA